MDTTDLEEDIVRSLRRITRAIDLHSRRLANSYGLTGPQLVCLIAVARHESVKPSEIAREVSLSQATVTGIIDRLAARQLVTRERTHKDRRVVTVTITEAGRKLVEQAPSPLQETFVSRLRALSAIEQVALRDTLRNVVSMMGGEELEAAAVLSTVPAALTPAEAKDEMTAQSTDLAAVAGAVPELDVVDTRRDESDPS